MPQSMQMGGEYGAELEDLALRRKYAEMLRMQAQQPPQSAGMAGRTVAPIHWTQALAGALKGVSGDLESQNIGRERKDLGRRYEADSQRRLQQALAMAQGNPQGASMQLAESPNPMQQQIGYGALGKVLDPKVVSPDALLRAQIELQKHRTPSASATLQEGGRNARFDRPSGGDVLREQGAMGRHQTPSGSAALAEQGAMARHGAPSGSALVSAGTARRGQDITDARQREANALTGQTVRLKQEELTNKLQQQGVANAGVVAAYKIADETLDRLKVHPGLGESVGVGWEKTAIPFVGPVIPGTDRANFVAELEAFKSQVFLPMVQNLRGMGALSDAEGKKLTAAVGALETNMDEKAFLASIDNIKKDLAAAQTRVLSPQRRTTDKTGAVLRFDAQGNPVQ